MVLCIEDLKKSYGSHQAIGGVNLEVREGELLALLGPNGAGKTTLVRCICGLTIPDSGSIRLLGKLLPRRGGRESIGLVPQEIALYQELTAEQNLLAFGRFHGLSGRRLRQRVAWALEWTGLVDQRRQEVRSFSGGMKRRVNIACGVLHRPRVVLLDEPTVGVDPQSRQRIFAMLDALREEGTGILLTTHHLDEAESQCQRIIIMDHGSIVASGTLPELIAQSVGTARHVRLKVTEPVRGKLAGWSGEIQGEQFTARLEDIGSQLPELLHQIVSAGYCVAEVDVQAPSLHHVFLHLTGHQLRDG